MRNILNNAYSITTNVEAEYEAGDKPTPLPAVKNNTTSDSVEQDDDFDWNGDDYEDYDNDVVILDNLENADREVGYTPALTMIENNVVKILQNQENLLSSTVENIDDFKTKYTDALNQKIC